MPTLTINLRPDFIARETPEADGTRWVKYINPEGVLVLAFMLEERYARHSITMPPPVPTTPDPDPTPDPTEPVLYDHYHTLRVLNIRAQPTTASNVVGVTTINQNLELSTEIVTAGVLKRLNLPDYPIEAGIEWRHIKGEPTRFIASKIGSTVTIAPGIHNAPSPTPANSAVKIVERGGKKVFKFKEESPYQHPVWLNCRPLAFFGVPNHAPHTKWEDMGRYIAEAKQMGVRVIRFYAASAARNAQGQLLFSARDCAARVKAVLDMLAQNQMFGHVVLDDSLGISGLYVPGAEGFRTAHQDHINRLYYCNAANWTAYHNFVREMLGVIGNHEAIFSIQLRNEWAMHSEDKTKPTIITLDDAKGAHNFALATVNLIRSLTKHHIDLGLISIGHVVDQLTLQKGLDFYRGVGVSFIGSHWYPDDGDMNRLNMDRLIADTLELGHVIDEIGVKHTGQNRAGEYQAMFNQFDSFASAYNVWGFDLGHGVGDDKGFSSAYPDYPQLKGLFTQMNQHRL